MELDLFQIYSVVDYDLFLSDFINVFPSYEKYSIKSITVKLYWQKSLSIILSNAQYGKKLRIQSYIDSNKLRLMSRRHAIKEKQI